MARKKSRRTAFTFTVPIYYFVTKKKTRLMGLNWYNAAHFLVKNKAKKHYLELVRDIVGNDGAVHFRGKVKIEYTIYLKRRGTDGGNVRSVIEKFVLDALGTLNVIKDDNASIVVADKADYFFDKENPRAEITIKPVR